MPIGNCKFSTSLIWQIESRLAAEMGRSSAYQLITFFLCGAWLSPGHILRVEDYREGKVWEAGIGPASSSLFR
jgi:hypothetical protein